MRSETSFFLFHLKAVLQGKLKGAQCSDLQNLGCPTCNLHEKTKFYRRLRANVGCQELPDSARAVLDLAYVAGVKRGRGRGNLGGLAP